MGNRYANPPVREAACEFRLGREIAWSDSRLGPFLCAVSDTFPRTDRSAGPETPTSAGYERAAERLLLKSGEGNLQMQVEPGMLTVIALPPYPGWGPYRQAIGKVYQEYARYIGYDSFQRIALRYVNRIPAPGDASGLGRYFRFRLRWDLQADLPLAEFEASARFPFEGGRDVLRLRMRGEEPAPPDPMLLLLELEYAQAQAEVVGNRDDMAWIDGAHDRIEEVFERCITDALRRTFSEGPPAADRAA